MQPDVVISTFSSDVVFKMTHNDWCIHRAIFQRIDNPSSEECIVIANGIVVLLSNFINLLQDEIM